MKVDDGLARRSRKCNIPGSTSSSKLQMACVDQRSQVVATFIREHPLGALCSSRDGVTATTVDRTPVDCAGVVNHWLRLARCCISGGGSVTR